MPFHPLTYNTTLRTGISKESSILYCFLLHNHHCHLIFMFVTRIVVLLYLLVGCIVVIVATRPSSSVDGRAMIIVVPMMSRHWYNGNSVDIDGRSLLSLFQCRVVILFMVVASMLCLHLVVLLSLLILLSLLQHY